MVIVQDACHVDVQWTACMATETASDAAATSEKKVLQWINDMLGVLQTIMERAARSDPYFSLLYPMCCVSVVVNYT